MQEADKEKDKTIGEMKEHLISEMETLLQRISKFEASEAERKRWQETLKESEARYRTIFETSPNGILVTDNETKQFKYANPALCKMLGYSEEELKEMHMKDIYPKDKLDLITAKLEVHASGEKTLAEDIPCLRKDGAIIYVDVNTTTAMIAESECNIGFFTDISERKRIDEEKREQERKAYLLSHLDSISNIAAGLSHEINNPLTAVIGYAQFLMKKDIPEDIKKDIESIHEGAQRVADIVKRLLAFARQYEVERGFVNINDTIAATVQLKAYELSTNNIKTTTEFAPDLPMTIADAGQLQQVFLNLITNAKTEMKSANGKGALLISTELVDNAIRISFKDDGPGVPRENLERIFEPFFTTRETGQGTGLGLSICHGIITDHKGRIYVESQPGQGATFIVDLPIITEMKQIEPSELETEEPPRIAGAKILVVDDEPTVLHFLSRVLTEEGHDVETAGNADDALERIKNQRYSIILLDIKMPGMSGIELYEHMRSIARSLARRVIFITGDILDEDTKKFLARTKNLYITKPIDDEQLKKCINDALVQSMQGFAKVTL